LSTGSPERLKSSITIRDIDIRFDKVTLKLTTHDEGGITEKDFSLALQCDEVFAKCSGS
jgi:pterin-4a-carbinolamine dehydratase